MWAVAGASVLSLAVALTPGCTFAFDDEPFTDPDCDANGFVSGDLLVCLREMDPHLDERTVLLAISDSNFLRAIAIFEQLPNVDVDIHMPGAVGQNDHRLDFYADANHNLAYDPPPDDHAWSEPITPGRAVLFAHNTEFFDIGIDPPAPVGGDLTVRFSGMTEQIGSRAEIRLIEDAGNRNPGLYLTPPIDEASFEIELPNIVDRGTPYRIEIFVDRNGNGRNDGAPTDDVWTLMELGEPGGITVNVSP